MRGVMRTRHRPTFQGFVVATALTASALALSPIVDAAGVPLSAVLGGAIGLFLQAFPFLLIGVLLSSAIETFLTQEFIERHFPRHAWAGMAVGVIAGFCMPVCDCATVPVFARMLHKRIPLSSAVVFLCAAPIINPVVIWSTWFAFPDKPYVTALRVGLGIVVSLAVGATFLVTPASRGIASTSVLRADAFGPTHDSAHGMAHDSFQSSSASCTVPDPAVSIRRSPRTLTASYLSHAHGDLMHIMPYMLTGILLASSIRVLSGSRPPAWLGGHGQLLSIAIMMLLAFISSLCSSSDAVIARGLVSLFPTAGLLGFLVFGPIMDVKNVLMLSASFNRRFVVRLGVTVTIVCFAAVALVAPVLERLGL